MAREHCANPFSFPGVVASPNSRNEINTRRGPSLSFQADSPVGTGCCDPHNKGCLRKESCLSELWPLKSGYSESRGCGPSPEEDGERTTDPEMISLVSLPSRKTAGSTSGRLVGVRGNCQMAFDHAGMNASHSSTVTSCYSVAQHHPARMTDKLLVDRRDDGGKFINNYKVVREIGRGSYGKVKLALDTQTGALVAIKQVCRPVTKMRFGVRTAAQERFSALQREIAVMKKLKHKHIVPLYEVIDDPDAKKIYLVMKYVDGGPIGRIRSCLTDNLEEEVCAPVPPGQLARYAKQIFSGLDYLHMNKIAHRDIKPENILVSNEGRAYLADFGVAEVFDVGARERVEQIMQESLAASKADASHGPGMSVEGARGTMLFIAPELWKGDRSCAKPVDVWAMGVTLYILLTGRLPFLTVDDILNPDLPLIPSEYGHSWEDLLRHMLDRDPGRRITACQAYEALKLMIHNKEVADNACEQTPVCVTQRDIEEALTLVEAERDSKDVSWVLGDHDEDKSDVVSLPMSPKWIEHSMENSGKMGMTSRILDGEVHSGANWVTASVRSAKRLSRRSTRVFSPCGDPLNSRGSSIVEKVELPPIPVRGALTSPVTLSSAGSTCAKCETLDSGEQRGQEAIMGSCVVGTGSSCGQPGIHTSSKQRCAMERKEDAECLPDLCGAIFVRAQVSGTEAPWREK